MARRGHVWLLFAMLAAIAGGTGLGVLLASIGPSDAPAYVVVVDALDFVGRDLFVGALKMIIAPLILASIVAGVTSMPTFGEAGRIGGRTLLYYVVTTTVAVAIGLVLVLLVQPGRRGNAAEIRAERAAEIESRREAFVAETGLDPATHEAEFLDWLSAAEGEERQSNERYARVSSKRDRGTWEMVLEDIVRPLLMNPFRSLAERNSLGIIFFALLLGLACLAAGEVARPVVTFFHAANAVILKLTHWIMAIAPVAVFCLVASIIIEHGLEVFVTLAWYCGTVIAGIALHVAFLLTLCAVVGRMSPWRFLAGIWEAWIVAFATRSSAATLPVTVRCLTQKLRVSPKVANFTLPVGATINMDGTALYEGVAVIFLIQIYGGLADVPIELGGAVTFVVFITAVLASVGAAAVPDAGLVTMVLVATAVHLPVYYIPLIFAVDAFLDMFRTSTNVLGDSVGAVVVARLSGEATSSDSPAEA